MDAGLSNGKGRGRERYGKKEAERERGRLCVCVLVCVWCAHAFKCVCEVFLQQPVRAGGLTAQTNGPLN